MGKKLILAFGASGFLGKYLVNSWLKAGWQVRLVSHKPYDIRDLKVNAEPGQLQVVRLDLSDSDACKQALPFIFHNVDAVFYGAASFEIINKNKSERLHVDAVRQVANEAKAQGIDSFVMMSGLGFDGADCHFAKLRVKAEKIVTEIIPKAFIVKPSLIFGSGDGFLLRFTALAIYFPFFVIPGANFKCQPIYGGDVAKIITFLFAEGDDIKGSRVFEVAGNETLTLGEALKKSCEFVGYKRRVFNLPSWILWPFVWLYEKILPKPFVTTQQLKLLKGASVAKKSNLFGFRPSSMEFIVKRDLAHTANIAAKNINNLKKEKTS